MSTAITNPSPYSRIERKVEARLDNRLCSNCKCLLETPKLQKFDIDAQVWICWQCGSARQWGENRPWNDREKPLLNCKACGCATRHSFLRVG